MAVKTQGTELYFIDPDTCTVTKVACVTTLSGITANRDQIETTCLDSDGRTYLAGMPNPGQAQFGINPDPDEPSHIRLHELYTSGVEVHWALGWSDGTAAPTPDSACEFVLPTAGPTGRSWITFDGFVNDFPFDFAINAVVASTLSIQISGLPEWTPKT